LDTYWTERNIFRIKIIVLYLSDVGWGMGMISSKISYPVLRVAFIDSTTRNCLKYEYKKWRGARKRIIEPVFGCIYSFVNQYTEIGRYKKSRGTLLLLKYVQCAIRKKSNHYVYADVVDKWWSWPMIKRISFRKLKSARIFLYHWFLKLSLRVVLLLLCYSYATNIHMSATAESQNFLFLGAIIMIMGMDVFRAHEKWN